MEEKFLTNAQVSKMLGITPMTLRNWDTNGKFKPHHVNPKTGYRYYTEEQIQRFLENYKPKNKTKSIVPVESQNTKPEAKITNIKEEYLKSGQAAKMLNISETTLRNWVKSGKLEPHHIANNGYKYYSKQKIQKLAKSLKKPIISTQNNNTLEIVPATTVNKNIKIQSDIPDFKPYVDKSTGQAIEPYNSMRNGAINAIVYATNQSKYLPVTEIIGDETIEITEHIEGEGDIPLYRYHEPMHDVQITMNQKELANMNPTVARGLMWLQLHLTFMLAAKYPSDTNIENACHMRWNIDNYMESCGLVNRKEATKQMCRILRVLQHSRLVWSEDVYLYDEVGNPIFSGSGKNRKHRHEKTKFEANGLITTFELKARSRYIEVWFNKQVVNYLAHAGVIGINSAVFKLNAHQRSSTFALAIKLQHYYFINRLKNPDQANVIGVQSLLRSAPFIPAYEDLKFTINGTTGIGYGWRQKIKESLERELETLVDSHILKEWYYRGDDNPKTYEEFIKQNIVFQLYARPNSPYEEIRLKKEAKQKSIVKVEEQ